MLLCGVLCTVLSVSFGAIVQIVIFLLQNSNILRVQASLPPGAEDEIILIEHLPGRRVHLQDFFWTDVKDAPLWVDPNQGLTFYETRTVHHTVTLYSPVDDKDNHEPIFPHGTDSNDPKCTTCIEPTPRLDDDADQNIGVLVGEDPGPRYWLLTVLRAGEAIPPKIELKLARLYRTAFSRQQQHHLGLLPTDLRFQRIARERALVKSKPEITNQEKIFENSAKSSAKLGVETNSESQVSTILKPVKMLQLSKFRNTLLPTSDINDIKSHNERTHMDDFQLKKLNVIEEQEESSSQNISTTTAVMDFNETTTDYTSQQYLHDDVSINLSSAVHNFQNLSDNYPTPQKQVLSDIDAENINTNKRLELRLLDPSKEEIIQVKMQNTSVMEGGATKLIYSVHLGGKPVPAETAARDMALLSPQEVALELGAPVLIQSEPYLKETRPLALSRKRDAWLLIGAASAGFILLALVLAGLILAAKRKRAHSAVAAPPNQNILKKKREYIQANASLDNAFSTSEMEIKTDGTSQRHTPGSLSRTPVSLETPDSLEAGIYEVSSNNDEEQERKAQESNSWEHPSNKSRLVHERIFQTNAIDTPGTSDSADVIVDHLETLNSLENNYTRHEEEATASPHSYLSMPSCKQFPSLKSVQPLSKVLEPVMVKHLDIDSPELVRREHDHTSAYRGDDKFFARTSSATKDPGVVGPIVWNLRKQNLCIEGNETPGTDIDPTYAVPSVPVGRARRRLHELLEDSFSLFGSRDLKSEIQCTTRPTSATNAQDVLTIFSETKGRSAYTSPMSSPSTETKAQFRTLLQGKHIEGRMAENAHSLLSQPCSGWSSRPLSAGPFHRPNLPDVDTRRILTDCQLPLEDPAVPLIASIKKELEKFYPQ
ncbi:hypothetical protein WH47_04419 [Habropoda laboriosa]|uniref:Uncharacterized protein n=1 Tax=Habropoda laboriosa TaxID=597456 RepID=A0A0L7QRA1_9HYME|nr:PREDICTED: uncharacterized protein LOC108576241 [Habropoda laboriosa]KOC61153.1 hypothetical protein WH47_04419 [Habropoda laboriosa]